MCCIVNDTPPSQFSSGRLHHIWSLNVIISKHMLKMALQPLRKPKPVTAKQSADFLHGSVYSPRNHVDTYFSNMSGTGSHKWAWRQTPALKYDVDLQRLHHKRGKLTQASCVSAKNDGGVKRSEKEEWVRGRDTVSVDSSSQWSWEHRYNRWLEIALGQSCSLSTGWLSFSTKTEKHKSKFHINSNKS